MGESAITRGMVLKLYLTESDARADTNALQVQDDTAVIMNKEQLANYNFFTHIKYYARIESNEPVLEFYIDWDDGEDNDKNGDANYSLIKFDTPQFVGITSHIFTKNKFHYPKIRVKSSDGYLSKFYQANGDNDFKGIDVLQGETSLGAGRNDTYKIESDKTGTDEERIPIFAPTPRPPICVLKSDKKRVYAGIDNGWLFSDSVTGDSANRDDWGFEGAILMCSDSTTESAKTAVQVRVTYEVNQEYPSRYTVQGPGGTTDPYDNTETAITLDDGTGASTVIDSDEIQRGMFGQFTDDDSSPYWDEAKEVVFIKAAGANVTGYGSSLGSGAGRTLAITRDHAYGGSSGDGSHYQGGSTSTSITHGARLLLKHSDLIKQKDMKFGEKIYNVKRIIKMELLDNLEETASSDTSKLGPDDKCILIRGKVTTNSNDNSAHSHQSWALGEVSLGNPIVELDDPRYTVTLDATESFTRSPDQSITHYNIWTGHTADERGISSLSEIPLKTNQDSQISDAFQDGSDDTLISTTGIKKTSYSFRPSFEFVDEDFRWLPKQMMAEAQATTAAAAIVGTDTLATYTKSYIHHWQDEKETYNYSDNREGVATYSWPADMLSSNSLYVKTASDFNNWTNMNSRSRQSSSVADDEDDKSILFASISGDGDNTTTIGDVGNLFPESTNNIGFSSGKDVDESEMNTSYMLTLSDKTWSGIQFNIMRHLHLGVGRADRVEPGGQNTTDGRNGNNAFGYMKIRVKLFYVAEFKDMDPSATTKYQWKPLKYIDYTRHPDHRDTTWYTSGSWQWNKPEDWAKVDLADITGNQFQGTTTADGALSFGIDGTTTDLFEDQIWDGDNKKYAIIAVITTGAERYHGQPKGMTLAVNNARYTDLPNQQLIEVVDPMHVSLNARAITQSLTYSHNGKYRTVTNRLGTSDIQRIGASGGQITFGGVDLIDEGTTYTRDKFMRYQRKATPVYIDKTHESGTISRFYGIITDMSEDHPTGDLLSKFAVTMQCSHMIEINSSGEIISDGYISLGGELIDVPKFY